VWPWIVGAVTALVVVVAAIGASGGKTASKTAAAPAPATPTVVSSSVAPVDPNIATCSSVNDTMLEVKATFDRWDIDNNEFDSKTSGELRASATTLYTLETQADGPAKDAIHAEASGLVDLSMAMESQDDAGVGTASDAMNRALAQLRGACNF
jgi:hypothetical protein